MRPRLLTVPFLLVLLWYADLAPGDVPARSPFVFVFVDAKTEKALGPFPYDRLVYAEAMERAAAAGARGVVVRFFLDLPKGENGDKALTTAMTKTKVVLQAGSRKLAVLETLDYLRREDAAGRREDFERYLARCLMSPRQRAIVSTRLGNCNGPTAAPPCLASANLLSISRWARACRR